MHNRVITLLAVVALLLSSVVAATDVSACPMKKDGMQAVDHIMNVSAPCPHCVHHGDKSSDQKNSKNNCCGNGIVNCGSSAAAFYFPTAMQIIAFSIHNSAFVSADEHGESAIRAPDKHPPRFLS